jgi:hypothetical protein
VKVWAWLQKAEGWEKERSCEGETKSGQWRD